LAERILFMLEVAVATDIEGRPIYELAADAIGAIVLEGLTCRDQTLRKAYTVVSASVEKRQLLLQDAKQARFIYTIATDSYTPVSAGSTAFSDEVKEKSGTSSSPTSSFAKEVKEKESSDEEGFSLKVASSVDPDQYTDGVLSFLYHDERFSPHTLLSAHAPGIKELTQVMTTIRSENQGVFFNMFAAPSTAIPINDSVSGNHNIGSIRNMAEAWLGQKVSNPQADAQRSLPTGQGAILLQFRAPSRKVGTSESLGRDVWQANLEISVRPSSSTGWTKIVDLHIDPA